MQCLAYKLIRTLVYNNILYWIYAGVPSNLDESFNIKKIPFDGALKDQYNKCKGSRFVIKSNTQELLDYNRENRPDELVGSKCPYTKFKKWLKR